MSVRVYIERDHWWNKMIENVWYSINSLTNKWVVRSELYDEHMFFDVRKRTKWKRSHSISSSSNNGRGLKRANQNKKKRRKNRVKENYAWEHSWKLTCNSVEYFWCCCCCVRCWIEINFFVHNTLRWWYVSMGFRWNNKGSWTETHTAIDMT